MYHCQRINYRHDHLCHLFLADLSSARYDIFFQIHTIQIFHDKIGRIIFVKKFINRYNIRIPVKSGYRFCFFKKFFRAFFKKLLLFTCVDSKCILPGLSRRQTIRKVFLDRHLTVTLDIIPKVSNPESASSQHFPDQIFSCKNFSYGKRTRRRCILIHTKSTYGTKKIRLLHIREAVFTDVFSVNLLHCLSS